MLVMMNTTVHTSRALRHMLQTELRSSIFISHKDIGDPSRKGIAVLLIWHRSHAAMNRKYKRSY